MTYFSEEMGECYDIDPGETANEWDDWFEDEDDEA